MPETAPTPPAARCCWPCCSRIEADTLPTLGVALLKLEQGDTTAAARRLEDVAEALPPAKGGAELRLLAGRLSAAAGETRSWPSGCTARRRPGRRRRPRRLRSWRSPS